MNFKALFLLLLLSFWLPCSPVLAQIPSYVPTTGLVAYYPFNGDMTDATGNGNDGVLYGSVGYGVDRFGSPASCYSSSGAGEGDVPVNTFPTGNAARSISVFLNILFLMPEGAERSLVGAITVLPVGLTFLAIILMLALSM